METRAFKLMNIFLLLVSLALGRMSEAALNHVPLLKLPNSDEPVSNLDLIESYSDRYDSHWSDIDTSIQFNKTDKHTSMSIQTDSLSSITDHENIELLGQIGGITTDIIVQDNFAYLSLGPRLVVLDVSNPNQADVVGQSDVLPGVLESVAVNGNYAYVTDECCGMHIIDLSNKNSPTIVGFLEMYTGKDLVEVVGDYAYIADSFSGLYIIDVANPVAPIELSYLEMSWSSVGGIAVDGGHTFVTQKPRWNGNEWVAGGFYIIDVSNPTSPYEVSYYETVGDATVYVVMGMGIDVEGSYAYVADGDGGLRIIDISNPASPYEVGYFDRIGLSFYLRAQDVEVEGDYAYVIGMDSANSLMHLSIINVAQPSTPSEEGVCDLPRSAFNISLENNYAFVADSYGGHYILDISTPIAPYEVSFFDAPGGATNVEVLESTMYVANRGDGLRIFDATDPTSPIELGNYHQRAHFIEVEVEGNYAYMGSGLGLRILDVTIPSNITEASYFSTPSGVHDVEISGYYAFIANADSGLRIINVSTPTDPFEVALFDTPGSCNGVSVSGNYAYITDFDAGMIIINISDPTNPTELGFYDTPGIARDVEVLGSYAYVADYNAGLRIIDISNPAAPIEVGFYNTPGYANDVEVGGDYAYVADYFYGLYVINISDPVAPTMAGFYETFDEALNVALQTNNAYIADEDGGLVILRFTGGIEPTYSISGHIIDFNTHNPIPDVDISNGAGDTTTTDSNGEYILSGLDAGTYRITPSKSGYIFSPSSITVSVPPEANNQDFVGSVDIDDDGLYDIWETLGYDHDGDGEIDVDLPAMGADPNHKDIFVEVDYMVEDICVGNVCIILHSHRPKPDAIARVVEAFKNAPVSNVDGIHGIDLHVDFGSDTPMRPGANWSEHSRSNRLPHDDEINWTDFDAFKQDPDNFKPARSGIFHYAIFAHHIEGLPCTSGSGRWPGWDFIVSLAGWGSLLSQDGCIPEASFAVGSSLQQAGTFMHELGHNLGLHHGGGDEINGKPNYLSVMNYAFQMTGLFYDDNYGGRFDYSRSDQIPALVESQLNEMIGLNGGSSTAQYGTIWTCPNGDWGKILTSNDPIDWNCNDNSNEIDVSANINHKPPFYESSPEETLIGHFDWVNLVYNGGAEDSGPLNSSETTNNTLPVEMTLEQYNLIPHPYEIALSGPGGVIAPLGYTTEYTFTVANTGENDDTYALAASSSLGWCDLSSVPSTVNLSPGDSLELNISVTIPLTAAFGEADELQVIATSTENPMLWTSSYARTYIIPNIYLPLITK